MTDSIDTLRQSGELESFVDFTRRYRKSPDLRARADAEPRAVLSECGVALPPGRDVRIVANTAKTLHFVLPPDPNALLADEDLAAVAGGVNADTATRTAFCLISCVSTFS